LGSWWGSGERETEGNITTPAIERIRDESRTQGRARAYTFVFKESLSGFLWAAIAQVESRPGSNNRGAASAQELESVDPR
jgi:hypothetical protein